MDSLIRNSDLMEHLVGNVIYTIPTNQILTEITSWILEGNHREVHNIISTYFEKNRDGLFSPVTLDRFMIDLSTHIESLDRASKKSSTLMSKIKHKLLTLLNNFGGTKKQSKIYLSNAILRHILSKLMAKYCYYNKFDTMISGDDFLKEWRILYGMNQNS